jgi:ferritin-like protein
MTDSNSSISSHEDPSKLSPETRDRHRALASLREEIEAVDWYAQRIDAAEDADLRRILAHNRDEEIEHACMLLEWLRRRDPVFDAQLRSQLFRAQPIALEEPSDELQDLGLGDLRDLTAGARPAQ